MVIRSAQKQTTKNGQKLRSLSWDKKKTQKNVFFFSSFLQNIKISKEIIVTKCFRNLIPLIIPTFQVLMPIIKNV